MYVLCILCIYLCVRFYFIYLKAEIDGCIRNKTFTDDGPYRIYMSFSHHSTAGLCLRDLLQGLLMQSK